MDNLVTAVLSALDRLDSYKFDITGFSLYANPIGVHLSLESFLENFNNYKATYRECSQYPIKLSEVVEGAEFFCLSRVEDFHAPSI